MEIPFAVGLPTLLFQRPLVVGPTGNCKHVLLKSGCVDPGSGTYVQIFTPVRLYKVDSATVYVLIWSFQLSTTLLMFYFFRNTSKYILWYLLYYSSVVMMFDYICTRVLIFDETRHHRYASTTRIHEAPRGGRNGKQIHGRYTTSEAITSKPALASLVYSPCSSETPHNARQPGTLRATDWCCW